MKGSTQGRTTVLKPGEAPDPKVALKDLDWFNRKMKVNLTPQQINLLR